MRTSHNCQRWCSSASPRATAAHLCSSSQATEPVLPRCHHIVRVFRAFLSRRNQVSAVGFFTTAFLLPTLPENSRSKKKKKNNPHFPYEVKQVTPRTCALKSEPLAKLVLHNQMGGGKWLLWWASAVLLKMWLKTLTKVTLPAVRMSSSLAKLFFIKWQHMTPKSIPNQ